MIGQFRLVAWVLWVVGSSALLNACGQALQENAATTPQTDTEASPAAVVDGRQIANAMAMAMRPRGLACFMNFSFSEENSFVDGVGSESDM